LWLAVPMVRCGLIHVGIQGHIRNRLLGCSVVDNCVVTRRLSSVFSLSADICDCSLDCLFVCLLCWVDMVPLRDDNGFWPLRFICPINVPGLLRLYTIWTPFDQQTHQIHNIDVLASPWNMRALELKVWWHIYADDRLYRRRTLSTQNTAFLTIFLTATNRCPGSVILSLLVSRPRPGCRSELRWLDWSTGCWCCCDCCCCCCCWCCCGCCSCCLDCWRRRLAERLERSEVLAVVAILNVTVITLHLSV